MKFINMDFISKTLISMNLFNKNFIHSFEVYILLIKSVACVHAMPNKFNSDVHTALDDRDAIDIARLFLNYICIPLFVPQATPLYIAINTEGNSALLCTYCLYCISKILITLIGNITQI